MEGLGGYKKYGSLHSNLLVVLCSIAHRSSPLSDLFSIAHDPCLSLEPRMSGVHQYICLCLSSGLNEAHAASCCGEAGRLVKGILESRLLARQLKLELLVKGALRKFGWRCSET